MNSTESRLSRIETLWTVVRDAHQGSEPAAHAAQQLLMDRYKGAVRRYLLASLRNEDAADEVFQEFALRFVRGDFHRADPSVGRFRSFVKTALYRLIVDYHRRANRLKLIENIELVSPPDDAEAQREMEREFAKSWRDDLLARAWAALKDQEQQTGKPYFTVLRIRADNPDWQSTQLAEELSRRLGKPMKAGNVRVILHRARDEFSELLFDAVVESLAKPGIEDVECELIELDLLVYCRGTLEQRRQAE